jgi:hypothetical protein
VVDIDTHGLGYERLRQPSFQGVRDDLGPEDLATTPQRSSPPLRSPEERRGDPG